MLMFDVKKMPGNKYKFKELISILFCQQMTTFIISILVISYFWTDDSSLNIKTIQFLLPVHTSQAGGCLSSNPYCIITQTVL